MAREWLFVLTYPVTIHRDNMLVIESEEGDYIPVFSARGEAEIFLEKVGGEETYLVVQAMHVFDARKLAKEKGLDLVSMSGIGQVLGRWSHALPVEG
jgi:hypothetical protein